MNAITKGGYQDVPMSRRRAQLLAEYAERLATMLENAPDDKDLAEWVQSKIDRATSAIQSAYHYLDQEDDLEKGAGHRYTHRKLVGRDPKTGRARYRYYYQEHHGGGITRAKLEEGSAFKLTFKGRRGHFHIESVQGDIVTVKHDGRTNSKPVQMSKAEFRALIKRQHGQALASHTEKLRRQVDKLKRNPTRKRSSLGLALHRLRQAAEKAGVTLPEEYQRKPKKKTSQTTETPREDRFDTMPEVESTGTSQSKTEFREKIEELKRLEDQQQAFTGALYRPQGLTKEQEKDILDKMQAEIAKKRDELTEGFVRPQSSEELETRLSEFLPTFKGLDYNRIEGYRFYVDREHRASLRARIKDLVGTGLNISPANQKTYGLNVAGTFKDLVRLLFALENEAKEETRSPVQSEVLEAVNQSQAFINDLIFNKQGKLTRARNRNKLKGYSDNGARSVAGDIVSETMREVSPHLMNHTNRQRYENQAHLNVARVLSESKGLTREEIAVSIETVLRDAAQKTDVLNPPTEMILPKRTGEISEFGERLADRETVEIDVSPTPTTARDQLTSTAQEIITEADQDHDERHDEHQSIEQFELGEHTHTKTGVKLFTAKQKGRTDRDEYRRRVEIAKKHGGRYERRYVKGFLFKTAEDARNFALEVEGGQVEERDEVQGFKYLEKLKAYAASKHPTKESFAGSNLGGTGAKRTRQVVEHIDRASDANLDRKAIHAELSQSGDWHYLHKVTVSEVDAHTHGAVEPSGREDLTKPIVVNHKGEVIDGRHRVMLARKKGITELPAYVPASLLYEKEISAETVTPHEDHPQADNFETMVEVESAPVQTADIRTPILRAVEQATPAHPTGYSSDTRGALTIGGFNAEVYGYPTKKEAVADARAKGHKAGDVVPVSNRFWTGYAISRIDPTTKERVFFDKTSAEPKAIKVPLADKATHQKRGHLFHEGGDIRTIRRVQGADNLETIPEPDPSPARQALTETADEIISEPQTEPSVQASFDTDAIQDAIDNGHELTPVITLQKQFIEKRDAGLLTPALLQESLRIYETMIEGVVEAKIKKKKKSVLLGYIRSNINLMTAYRLKSEKKQNAIDEMMSSFLRNVTNTPLMRERRNNVTYNIFDLQDRETDIERIKRLVSEYTEEDAIEDNKRLKAEIEQAKQRQAEKERLLSNPQTAQDFIELKRLRRNKGEDLSAEQHARHNDLVARSRRGKREDEKTKQVPQKTITGGFESFETKHSKTGADLYAVRPAERVGRDEYLRLKAEAKKQGGYYSSYRTVRGFVFPTPEAREQFIQANQQPEAEPQEPVDKQRAKRDALRERLEGYRDSANEALNADRRTNTARRARFARYATEDAFRRIEYVNRGQRILNAIDEGRAYHLQNISNATDLDMLQSIVNRAKSEDLSSRGLPWSEYEKEQDRLKNTPIEQSVLEGRDLYPDKLMLHPSDLKSLKKYLTRSDGTARRGARTALAELNAMLSEPKEKRHVVSMDTLMRVLAHVPPEADKSFGVLGRVVELKRDHDRMKRLGIENEVELKAALREYEDIVYQRSAEDEKAHREAEEAKAERDRLIRRGEFARMNIPSYFPTPTSVIDRMIEIAGIEEGETVLEPSAGAGHILEKLADTQASVKAIETNYTLRNYLEDQGHEVVGNDALEHSDTYDHVIMNPPFEKQADIEHVTHAFENNLVDGGRLVAVMSASAMTRDNKKARDFQDLVNKYGHYERLPEGTFKDSDRQTGVNTILVVLDLPDSGLKKSFYETLHLTNYRADLYRTIERLAS